jgi:hypothetical protein
MDSGVAGLIGAVIGGGLTAGSNLLLDIRRNKSAKEDEEAKNQREVRQASRLIKGELTQSLAALIAARQLGTNWQMPSDSLISVQEWSLYGSVLASHLEDDAWLACVEAYTRLNLIRGSVPPAAAHEDIGGQALAATQKALDRLKKHAED